MIYGLDTENDLQGRCTVICACNRTSRYTYRPGPASVGELIRVLSLDAKKEEVHVWSINLGYDLVNLFGADLVDFCTLYFGRRAIVGGKLRGAKVRFFDVSKFLPRKSAASIGEALRFPKMKVNLDMLKENKLPLDVLQKYCMRDAQIARKAGESIEHDLQQRRIKL